MATITSLDINDASMINYGKPNGLHWITAALFLIADMAGAGIVAFPIAMTRSGTFGGIIILILLAITFCYTACILSKNWIIMCKRWTVYAKHCRKPYPEMAYRAMGANARSICSFILNTVLFGVAVVFCLLAAYIINDFIISITNYDIGFCYVLLFVTIAIYPITLLRSPQDFWWAVVLAMLTTLFSVFLILIGSWLDYGKCGTDRKKLIIRLNDIVASFGTYMFGFGGHIVFPSVQHDMKYPKHFIRSAILAFIDFGWHRIIIRTIVLLAILFVAETVPKFGPILNVIGGSTVALTSAMLPLIYNNYLNASIHDPITNTYKRPTFLQVLQRNSRSKLLIDFIVIVVSVLLGMGTTYIAIIDMSSTDFTAPCYLSFAQSAAQNASAQLLSEQSSLCD
uniref:Amino acid transporter transmembrane domain-containing protein n=1 Tax=Wuchereria bancrofti TaxID=6293 RepID=A0AAF5PZH9_WUCBA